MQLTPVGSRQSTVSSRPSTAGSRPRTTGNALNEDDADSCSRRRAAGRDCRVRGRAPALAWYTSPGGLTGGAAIPAVWQIPEVIRYATTSLIGGQPIGAADHHRAHHRHHGRTPAARGRRRRRSESDNRLAVSSQQSAVGSRQSAGRRRRRIRAAGPSASPKPSKRRARSVRLIRPPPTATADCRLANEAPSSRTVPPWTVRRTCDAVTAARSERHQADLVHLAEVRVLHLRGDHHLHRIAACTTACRPNAHFDLQELAVGRDAAVARDVRPVGELHDGVQRVNARSCGRSSAIAPARSGRRSCVCRAGSPRPATSPDRSRDRCVPRAPRRE